MSSPILYTMDAIEYAQCMYNVPLLVTCLQNYSVYIVILVRTCQKVRLELLRWNKAKRIFS